MAGTTAHHDTPVRSKPWPAWPQHSAADGEALLKVLEPFGIRELVQSGAVAIGRGSRSIADRALRSA